MRTEAQRKAWAGGMIVALLVVGAGPMLAEPAAAQAGTFPQCPVVLDVLFVLDTTGSMGGVIDSAKSGAISIMNAVRAEVPDTRFGVANYKDYPAFYNYPGYATDYGGWGDYPWQLNTALTFNNAAVQNGINPLSASGGADEPESMTRALYESRFQGWRSSAVKIVILFTDARAHDADFAGMNTGGDPGRDGIAMNADDLDFQTTAAQLAADGIRVIGIGSGANGGVLYLQHLAAVTNGRYAPLAGDFVGQVVNLIFELVPRPSVGAHAVGARAEVSNPANPLVEVAPAAIAALGSGSGEQTAQMAHRALPTGPTDFVSAVNDGARGGLAAADAQSAANSTIAEVSLLGGLVYARELHAVASSRTVAGATASSSAGSSFGLVRVNGQQIDLPVAPNTIVPIPGVGVVVLHEVRHWSSGTKASEVAVTMIRVVVDMPTLRGEIAVGRATAGSSCGPALGATLQLQDNDGGSGKDAGDTPAAATPLANPSVIQGRLNGGDFVDHFRIAAQPGEKVSAVLLGSPRASAAVRPLPAVPGAGAGIVDVDLQLLQPGSFAVREESVSLAGLPERVELNVDVPGQWVVRVERKGLVEGNYTLAVAVTPILLSAQNDGGLGGDAPNACGAPQGLGNGAHTGVLRDADYQDWFRVRANLGDAIALALKPTEDADGADFDLALYDRTCTLLNQGGPDTDALAKGTPETVARGAPYTGDYWVQVQRINGIGNYYLAVAVQDPQPTLPGPLDAEAGGDAGSSPATARALANPAVVQGRMPDGDTEDWYRFQVPAAGKRVVAATLPQALSDVSLTLLRPDGSVAANNNNAATLPDFAVITADQAGTWHLVVTKQAGGGDYVIALAVQP